MHRTTRSSHDEGPRPIGQSFWLLATMVMAAIVVMAMSNAFAAGSTTTDGQFSSQELLDLANGNTVAADPAAPAASAGTAAPASAEVDEPSTPSTSTPATLTPTTPAPTTSSTTPSPTTPTPDPTEEPTTGSEASNPEPAELADTATDDPTEQPTGVQARGEAALATISYPWRQLLPEWRIDFLPEKSGLYGLTMVPEERIEIYVRDGQSTELLAHVIAHELGHAVDVSLNDGPDRRRWEEARGLSPAPWWPGSGATDFSTGAGDFAESFAAWQVGDLSFRSELGDAPTTAQIELLAELSAG